MLSSPLLLLLLPLSGSADKLLSSNLLSSLREREATSLDDLKTFFDAIDLDNNGAVGDRRELKRSRKGSSSSGSRPPPPKKQKKGSPPPSAPWDPRSQLRSSKGSKSSKGKGKKAPPPQSLYHPAPLPPVQRRPFRLPRRFRTLLRLHRLPSLF